MKTIGKYVGASRDLKGNLLLQFSIDLDDVELREVEELKDKKLALEVKEYKEKRSLDANAYFWKLCDEIAKKVGSDKDTVYLMMLKQYGVFDYFEVFEEAVEILEPLYRVIDTVGYTDFYTYTADGEEIPHRMAVIHAYKGSHLYDTKEMSDLISGTVRDAEDLGIPTITPRELEQMKGAWRK